MEDLKKIFAENLIRLRQRSGMTQAELGEKLNYSDKSISKWERGESIPDAFVLKELSALFGVTVDDLLSVYDENSVQHQAAEAGYNFNMIMLVSFVGVWTLAFLIFILLWLNDIIFPLLFFLTLPVSLVVLLVLRSVWSHGRHNFWVVSALMFSIFIMLYFCFWHINPWQLLLMLIPGELLVWLCFHIKRR